MSESMGEGWGIRSILLCIVYELALHLVPYIYCEHVRLSPGDIGPTGYRLKTWQILHSRDANNRSI
jgi:hypothetical protein